MKKRIKGLITLWLALVLMCGVMTVPAFAASTTNAYYYTGIHALESGFLATESNSNVPGTPSTDAFEYGAGAETIALQLGSTAMGQVGWKVWGAYSCSGGFEIGEEFVAKALEKALTQTDYDSIILWYDTVVIERIFLSVNLADLTLTPDTILDDGVIYSATISANEGYSLPDAIFVFSHGTILELGTDYTYNSTTGEIEIKESGVEGNITLIANGKIRHKEFRMGGTNNAMLQWRYEGETTWNDITAVQSSTSITIGANGNLFVNGSDTGIKVNYVSDISEINTKITNLQASLGNKADATVLSNAITELTMVKTTITTLQTTLAGKADSATVEALDAAYKAADKALEDAVKALESRVEVLETTIANKADATVLSNAVTELTTVKTTITTLQTTLAGKADSATVEALDAAYKA
ncbi:MAG: hypothetical protein IJX55_04430, partial [Clostridia bacterium]|nr:hypothetical protein [Clostridia bacterium]